MPGSLDSYTVGENDGVVEAQWPGCSEDPVRRSNAPSALLPSWSPGTCSGVIQNTVSCKTDPRNSLVWDEIWISWLVTFLGFHRFFFFNCSFPTLQTFDTFDMQVGDHLGLAWQRGRQVKPPLTFVFSSGHTAVSEIWFSFLVQAGPARLGMCYILTTPRPSQAEAELKQIWAGLQAAQLGQMCKLNIMNSVWWLLGTVSQEMLTNTEIFPTATQAELDFTPWKTALW